MSIQPQIAYLMTKSRIITVGSWWTWAFLTLSGWSLTASHVAEAQSPAVPATTAAHASASASPIPVVEGQRVKTNGTSLFGKHYLTVPATIHGHPLNLIADLGAEIGVFFTETMTLLKLPDPDPGSPFPLSRVDSLALGSKMHHQFQVLVFPQEQMEVAKSAHFDGLLGIDVLSYYDIEFDLAKEKLRFYVQPAHAVKGEVPAWLPAGIKPSDCVEALEDTVQKLDFTGINMRFPIEANGHTLESSGNIFDSGSDATYMNWPAAELLGLSKTSPNVRHATENLSLGSNGPAETWVVDDLILSVGGRPVAPGPIYIIPPMKAIGSGNDTDPTPTLALGSDSFRDRPLFMSYSTGMMCIGDPTHP